MNATDGPPKKFPLSILWALMFFCGLWVLDFPKPVNDDLFYVGAGLNMAQGGDFSNPLLEREGFTSHYFFAYPPFYSYALAGWLKIVGISAASMTGFQGLVYVLLSISTIMILRKYDASVFLEWLVPLGVFGTLSCLGLRTEPLAVALGTAGFAVFICSSRGPFASGIAYLLMFLGGVTAPRPALFAAGLAIYSFYLMGKDSAKADISKLKLWAPPFAAGIVTVAVFLVQIHFRVGEFLHTFGMHSKRVAGGKIHFLISFFNENPYLSNAQLPWLFFFIGLLIFAWPKEKNELVRMSLVSLVAFPFVALVGGLGPGAHWYLVFSAFLFLAGVLKTNPDQSRKLQIVFAVALCFANVEGVTESYGRLTGKVKSDRGEDAERARAMRSSPGHTVLVDQSVARYIFNYRIPAGILDVQSGAPFPKSHVVEDMQPGDVYLVSPDNIRVFKEYTMLNRAIDEWGPFGLWNRKFYQYPFKVNIIPMEDCHGLKAGVQTR